MTERPGRVGTDATERLALTRPQAEAFVTLNAEVAHDVEEPVTTAPFDALRRGDALPAEPATHVRAGEPEGVPVMALGSVGSTPKTASETAMRFADSSVG
jgi:hypothetical protein